MSRSRQEFLGFFFVLFFACNQIEIKAVSNIDVCCWYKYGFAQYFVFYFGIFFPFFLTQDKKTELIEPEADESKVKPLVFAQYLNSNQTFKYIKHNPPFFCPYF